MILIQIITYYTNYFNYFLLINYDTYTYYTYYAKYLATLLINMVLLAVLSDDELAMSNQLDPFDVHHENMPHWTRTPPTPPSRSPPPASPRVRAVAQLRPVSIPDIVRDMAGNNPQQKLADFDRHCMPDGVQ